MEYREALIAQVEEYYQKVVYPYNETTTNAMNDARKMGLFKKRDFGVHIRRFRSHMETAAAVKIAEILIPDEDTQAKLLWNQLCRSIDTFLQLCEKNIRFYEITDKKQYRGSGLVIREFKEAAEDMQLALKEAVLELELLDKTYQKYTADDSAK